MSDSATMVLGLAVLSLVPGMLGLGVAFAAVPFLGLFLPDLVHQVQPLSLLLNALTGLFSTIGFARSGLVEWRRAAWLAVVTTVSAPAGAYLAQHTRQAYIWALYFAAVVFLAYRLFRPVRERAHGQENYRAVLVLAVPISVLSGLLGVGPGFLLLPTLILCGFEAKRTAGMNNGNLKSGSDARSVKIFPVDRLPPLAFDHNQIIRDALENTKASRTITLK